MEKIDEECGAKFINALVKSVQSLCHGYLDFDSGVEIIGHINLSVDKGSSLHYILEEKVCKNEENSTLFISNSFHAQNQKPEQKTKERDSPNQPPRLKGTYTTESTDLLETGTISFSVSSVSSAVSCSSEVSRTDSSSSSREVELLPATAGSSCPKRKGSSEHLKTRTAKVSRLSSVPSPTTPFSVESPKHPSQSDHSSHADRRNSHSHLQPHCENVKDPVVRESDGEKPDSSLGISLAGSVLEPVGSNHTSPVVAREGKDSDGDCEVLFIKQEFMEGESGACRFQGSGGEQYSKDSHRKASSDSLPDSPRFPAPLPHSAAATYVPGSREHDAAAAELLYGPSTSSHLRSANARGRNEDQQGAALEFRHTSHMGFAVGDAAFHPPLAHSAHQAITHHALELSVLDLSIKTEPNEQDYVLFNCEQRRKKNSVYLHSDDAGSRTEEARQKAKEKSREYRMKQKVHRMRDSTYDMIFRHQVAERKRRQRMRERLRSLKHHSVTGYSIAQ